jgi:hypothetical protein
MATIHQDRPDIGSCRVEDQLSRSNAVKQGHTAPHASQKCYPSRIIEKKEGQVQNASGKEDYGELRVTGLKMVSATCSK